ncbi:hypothetical protein NLI96_g4544 [Meripilus lineatus]|uniref:Uncharacterized protein n=1 Tax=Meripilus lineatus TaxID=2056292 RepID=A0AAD5V9Q3_9APHY|nr:hypothetical protein NLI96_g4544 [Physisporinus lineatus]
MNYNTPYLLAAFALVLAVISPIASGGSVPSLTTRTEFRIEGNGNTNYLDLGLVISPNNGDDPGGTLPASSIGPGSFHYLFVDATTHTEPHATPALQDSNLAFTMREPLTTESSIWNLADTGELTPAWVNEDGSVSDQQLFLHYPLSEFLIIADFPSFFNKFTPGASVIPVAWVLVPDSG